jgi:hypothetical protein
MDDILLIIIIVCLISLSSSASGGYYYTTTQNSVNSKDNNMTPSIITSTTQNSVNSKDDNTTPCVIPSTTPCVIPSTTPYVIPSTTPCVIPSTTPCVIPSTTPCVIPSTTPCTTPTKTPSNTYPKGVTIFSEPDFKGKSLFLKSNNIGEKTYFDRNYFNMYWANTRMGSFQFSKGDEFYFFFNSKDTLDRSIYAGSDETCKTMKRIFGAESNIIISEIIDATIYTPKQYKEYWCRHSGDNMYISHFKDYPDTKC